MILSDFKEIEKFRNFFVFVCSKSAFFLFFFIMINDILLSTFVSQSFFHIHNSDTDGTLKSNTNRIIKGFVSGKNVRMRKQ